MSSWLKGSLQSKNHARQRCHAVVAHVNPRLQRPVDVTLELCAQGVLEPPVEIHSLKASAETFQPVHCNEEREPLLVSPVGMVLFAFGNDALVMDPANVSQPRCF